MQTCPPGIGRASERRTGVRRAERASADVEELELLRAPWGVEGHLLPGAGAAWGRDATLQSVVDLGGTFVIAGKRLNRPVIWVSGDGLAWSAVELPIADGTDGEAAKAATFDGRVVVFQGETPEEYHYWLPMGNYCFTSFQLPMALWYATDPAAHG